MTTCRYAGKNQPRLVTGQHHDDCPGAEGFDTDCSGCAPCGQPHCRVCGRVHVDHTCAECLAETRSNLRAIGTLTGTLPDEVEHRGLNGEAMNLLGPAIDPEALGHVEASIAAGRLPADWLDHPDPTDRLHPMFTVGNWDMLVRDALEHDEVDGPWILATGIEYLDRQLTYLAAYPHLPFEDLASDLQACVDHLQRVVHDGEQIEKGAPCLICKRKVTRKTLDDGEIEFYCDRCQRVLPEPEYRRAVAAAYIAYADRLNIADLSERIEVKQGTLRRWASVRTTQRVGEPPVEHPPLLRSCGRDKKGRKVYRVADAVAIRDGGGDTRGSAVRTA